MLFRMEGLVLRGGVYTYRRMVPRRLRDVLGVREVKRTLGTGDLGAAQRRWKSVNAEVEQMFAEAEKAVRNPSVAAYKVVEEWRQWAASRPVDDDHEEAVDLAITDLLERDGLSPEEKKILDRYHRARMDRLGIPSAERARVPLPAVLQALLKRHESGGEDNPPLSILADRYYAEKKLPIQTQQEWKRVIRLFTESIGADVPVRSITAGHVRDFKTRLLTTPSEATERPMSRATIQKLLSAVRAVLSWGRKQGYLTSNPAEGITQLSTKPQQHEEDRKLPFTMEQAQTVLKAALKGETPTAYRWLWLIGFYTGARIDEIAGLRREDLRTVDGVLCFDIRPHEGRRLKNSASRRLVPVHPALIEAGFTVDVLPFKSTGHYYSKRINPWMRKETSITDPRLTFHSTRHTFKDRLRAARVPEPIQRALMGHGKDGVADGYGLGYPMALLAEEVGKVRY
jgi:integrase